MLMYERVQILKENCGLFLKKIDQIKMDEKKEVDEEQKVKFCQLLLQLLKIQQEELKGHQEVVPEDTLTTVQPTITPTNPAEMCNLVERQICTYIFLSRECILEPCTSRCNMAHKKNIIWYTASTLPKGALKKKRGTINAKKKKKLTNIGRVAGFSMYRDEESQFAIACKNDDSIGSKPLIGKITWWELEKKKDNEVDEKTLRPCTDLTMEEWKLFEKKLTRADLIEGYYDDYAKEEQCFARELVDVELLTSEEVAKIKLEMEKMKDSSDPDMMGDDLELDNDNDNDNDDGDKRMAARKNNGKERLAQKNKDKWDDILDVNTTSVDNDDKKYQWENVFDDMDENVYSTQTKGLFQMQALTEQWKDKEYMQKMSKKKRTFVKCYIYYSQPLPKAFLSVLSYKEKSKQFHKKMAKLARKYGEQVLSEVSGESVLLAATDGMGLDYDSANGNDEIGNDDDVFGDEKPRKKVEEMRIDEIMGWKPVPSGNWLDYLESIENVGLITHPKK
ncbi:hypothetical protein RFI_07732 [Reticulomyxa filosa]|uniref:Uncharacterized protein n=1 Tax=Reticulomyxa filosa TaxID=46433 RepID=X6NUE0_RETFI|nr:hypothetical protein RFI_07732 [Reticulomyxa filosa]|eukprot:ETO29389.1 hypothetical protein RFI_07732 [Reticulomyxa filosa]